ncbi:MAG TPA: alpha/beta hydrolase [Hyphomicrobiaceae bacterium]|nr:alpha/beta hydrolase [Hyphomicrobiaceae bacterium]
MSLVSIARNPVPSGAVAGMMPGHDGVLIRFARWYQSTAECRGTVVICPGRSEFIEKYFETVADLRRRGFAVAILDWRGQGGSQRLTRNPLKGHVRHFRDYDSDLGFFLREIVIPHLPPPYLALGHSLGGHILLRFATVAQCPFQRLVVTAPMIRIADEQLGQPRGIVRAFSEVSTVLGFGSFWPPGQSKKAGVVWPFEGNVLTSSRERYERSRAVLAVAPELELGPPTLQWLAASFRSSALIETSEYAARIRLPVLMLVAGDDRIVSSRAIEDYAPRLKLGSHVLIGRSRHEILQENDDIRSRFWAAFDAFAASAGDAGAERVVG